jgi:OmpA-OmpF porin, OOP family
MTMIKLRLLIITLFVSTYSFAQRVYWAADVLDFSSELSAYEYSAEQILGKPNVLPQGGDNPNAWMPAKPNKLDFISVAFEKPVQVQQIVIAETYNPSGVYEIYLYDKNGKEYLVNTFDPKPINIKSRLLRINIEKTKYEVASLRLIIDGRKVPGYCGIDAIGVSPSIKPIEIAVEQPQNLRENILVERLSDNVNSQYKETRPLIAPDGKTLYFSRANDPANLGGEDDENDIWYSQKNESTGEWETSKNMGEPLNNKGQNYISSITPDGSAMTVLLGNEYGSGNKMKPGVSVSTKTGEKWSDPQALDIINANIMTDDGNYFLANNRKVLIMAIDRYDTYGGKDLYVSFLQRDNRWTEPMNLGNDINTAHMEASPYLAADNETLYFSSAGFSGYGGNDVYISRRLDDTWTNWTEPENLGPDINSDGDDIFFNIPPSGQFAYYSKSIANGNGDIYRIAMPVFYQPAPVVSVMGKVTDENKNPVVAKISYNLMPENSNVGFTMSDSVSGEYEILLPVGSAYDFRAEAQGFAITSDRIDLQAELDYKVIERNILMLSGVATEPVVAVVEVPESKQVEDFISGDQTKLVMDNAILFEFASDYLNETANQTLDKLVMFMKDKPGLQLIIAGHTDTTGPAQYNKSLSKRRADSVANYFIKNGISKDRLEIVGYGQDNPVASNDTTEGRKKNRRVEFSLKQ